MGLIDSLGKCGYFTAENAVGEAKQEVGTGSFEKLLRASLQSLSAPKGRSTRAGT